MGETKPGVEEARVLVVDPDAALARSLSDGLDACGLSCLALGSLVEAQLILDTDATRFDVILLALTATEGATHIDTIRALGQNTPILVLTATQDTQDRIKNLDLGADDCMSKPIVIDEVIARVHAILRRSMHLPVLRFGNLCMNLGKRVVYHRETALNLSPKEFDVLRVLIQAHGRHVSRDVLRREAWGEGQPQHSNVVEMLMTRLRRKLQRFIEPRILTEPGQGYRLYDSESTPN